MILTIIILIIAIVGWIIVDETNGLGVTGAISLILGFGGTIISIILFTLIIVSHVGINNQIEQNKIEYNSLCQRIEIIQSNYEDVSKSDVIKDVAEWNKMVISNKYWGNNPWTNWFYSKKITNNLKTINIDDPEPSIKKGE